MPKQQRQLTEFKLDPTNPREIKPAALRGLGVAMADFGDLSGITWNTYTGELVCGHQRFDRLQAAGAKEWTQVSATEGYIEHPETRERFGIRPGAHLGRLAFDLGEGILTYLIKRTGFVGSYEWLHYQQIEDNVTTLVEYERALWDGWKVRCVTVSRPDDWPNMSADRILASIKQWNPDTEQITDPAMLATVARNIAEHKPE